MSFMHSDDLLGSKADHLTANGITDGNDCLHCELLVTQNKETLLPYTTNGMQHRYDHVAKDGGCVGHP